jgi:hypothetical protein
MAIRLAVNAALAPRRSFARRLRQTRCHIQIDAAHCPGHRSNLRPDPVSNADFSLPAVLRIALARAMFIIAIVSLAASVLVATGMLGRVALGPDEPKDAALVVSLVRHAAIGMALALVQCAIAITLGRLLFRRPDIPVAQALLLGLPASLAFLALGAGTSLAVPFGGWLAVGCTVLLLIPLRGELGSRARLLARAKQVVAVGLPAALFGIWLGLLWHGPTATLSGWPSGDQVYYTSLVTTLATDPWPLRNWGNEGETAAAFNLLWPALGAALSKAIAIEPFAFIVTAGGTAFMAGTTIALRAYVVANRPSAPPLSAIALVLGMLAAGRYPFWIVESPPMIHAIALTVAIGFWVSKSRAAPSMAVGATTAALIGALVTKVTTAVTLVPFAMSAVVPEVRNLSRSNRILVLILGAVAVVAAVWMLWQYAPRLYAVGGIGPESYVFAVTWGNGWASATSYVLRDLGTALLAAGAFLLLPWWSAVPIALGLLGGLFIPFTLRAASVASTVLIALAALDSPRRMSRAVAIIVVGLLLCVPAMLETDPGGWQTGVVWLGCVLAAAWFILDFGGVSSGDSAAAGSATYSKHLGSCITPVFAGALLVSLLAVARGEVGMASNWREDKDPLTPEIRALWRAVPESVPRDALVFTDQTGPGSGLREGWNTYAFHGRRQLFISTWIQSGELQADASARAAKLRWNERVLDGTLEPARVPLTGTYSSFFAVVDRSRVSALAHWTVVRDVGRFVILRWNDGATPEAQSRQ